MHDHLFDDDSEPTHAEMAQFALDSMKDLAVARRFIAAMHAEDRTGVAAITREVVSSGRGTNVLYAMAIQALEFAAQIVPNEERLQQQLDLIAMQQLDASDEVERLADEPLDGRDE